MGHLELLKKFPKPLLPRLLAPAALAGVKHVSAGWLALRASQPALTCVRKHEPLAANSLGKSGMNRSNAYVENSKHHAPQRMTLETGSEDTVGKRSFPPSQRLRRFAIVVVWWLENGPQGRFPATTPQKNERAA